MPNLAPVKWAQRKDSIFVTIVLPDVTDETVELTGDKLTFKGKSGGEDYDVELKFFAEVDPEKEGSKWAVGKRNILFHIMKKEEEGDSWTRLLEDKKLEKTNVKVDWDKYVDSDEETEGFDTSAMGGGGGMDFANMMGGGGGGGPPGMGGMPPGMGGMGGMGGPPGGMGGMMGGMGGMMGGMPGMGGGPGGMDPAAMEKMMAAMGGMGGMGGPPGGDAGGDAGGDEEVDSDDDDLPDLEEDGDDMNSTD